MKTIKRLRVIYKNKPFLIKVYRTNSPSNYNLFVSVFQKGENMPLVGKSFKDNSTNDQIKEWALFSLKWPEMQYLIK